MIVSVNGFVYVLFDLKLETIFDFTKLDSNTAPFPFPPTIKGRRRGHAECVHKYPELEVNSISLFVKQEKTTYGLECSVEESQ